MPLSKIEFVKAGAILIGAIIIMWAFMIRPHSFQWDAAGNTTATVKA